MMLAAQRAAARMGVRLVSIERSPIERRTMLLLADTNNDSFLVAVEDSEIRSEAHPERAIERAIGEVVNRMTGPAALAGLERALDDGAMFEPHDEERLERMSVRLAEIVDALRR